MRGTAAAGHCRMKTGTLIGVSALSGYCNAAGGDVIAFSFLENKVCAVCAKRIEDRMVPAIARYSRG
jgi:D-alanyl-D-alanine carboxypeptidase/D-alanyl-D-alanine-endopeptidase (penicillin-binding protein 4)